MTYLLAEVSDKIPPAAFFWLLNAVVAAVVFALAWNCRPGIIVLFPLSIAWFWLMFVFAVQDDQIMAAAVEELGRQCVYSQIAAAMLPLAASLAPFFLRKLRRSR
jgi:hypothetical protein